MRPVRGGQCVIRIKSMYGEWGWQQGWVGDTGPLTWRSSSVGGPPGIETETAKNLWEAGVRMPSQGERLGDTVLETKGLGHLSTVAPSD